MITYIVNTLITIIYIKKKKYWKEKAIYFKNNYYYSFEEGKNNWLFLNVSFTYTHQILYTIKFIRCTLVANCIAHLKFSFFLIIIKIAMIHLILLTLV